MTVPVPEKTESTEEPSVFLKPSVQFGLYLLPIIIFFILFDVTIYDKLLTSFTWVNYVAGYIFYLVMIEFARLMHSNKNDATRAKNAFNQLVVYFPLSLFLLTASYALYMAGSEVFNVEPLAKQHLLQAETHKYLEQYKTECENAKQSSQEQLNCVQKYLDGSIFAQLDDLKEKYENTSNSYSIIAIMTGFFGVLMTVLVIYFSLSGREVLQDKLDKSEALMKKTAIIFAENEANLAANSKSLKQTEESFAQLKTELFELKKNYAIAKEILDKYGLKTLDEKTSSEIEDSKLVEQNMPKDGQNPVDLKLKPDGSQEDNK